MKLTGTAQGNSYRELLQDAHRQAGAFFNSAYELECGEAVASSEYNYRIDGSLAPTYTTFEAYFVATLVGE